MDVRETEWQFDAVDLQTVLRSLGEGSVDGEAVQTVPEGTATHKDLYLDTDDHRLHRAGYALRIRRIGRRQGGEATLKSLDAGGRGGVRDRREVRQELARAEIDDLLAGDGPVSERVRAVAGRKPLLALFTVRTRRRSFTLTLDGTAAGAVALDEAAITPASATKTTRLRRVEVEVDAAALDAAEPFVERLRAEAGLQPATLSKYEAGLLVADLKPTEPDGFGPIVDDADESSIGSVAVAVLRRNFAAFLAREPGARLGDDTEELHDMRVASRRLRAALSLFAEVLPARIMNLAEELRWIGGVLGDVRDLDVQLEQLAVWRERIVEEDRPALEPLRELLDEHRAAGRASLLATLDSRRYESFVDRFARALRAQPPRGPTQWRTPALDAAPALINKRFRAFRKAGERLGPESSPPDYHRLRIRAKRLRYALECFSDVYGGETRAPIKRLVALQDVLGSHQDADVAIQRLRGLATDAARPLEPSTAFAMGEIAERYRRSTIELRASVPAAYARASGKSWRTFSKAIERRREPTSDAGNVES
jgi:triphosphatase